MCRISGPLVRMAIVAALFATPAASMAQDDISGTNPTAASGNLYQGVRIDRRDEVRAATAGTLTVYRTGATWTSELGRARR